MTLQNEYEKYLERLNRTIEGKALLAHLPKLAKDLYLFLSSQGEGVVKTALSIMDESTILDLCEKNFVLILGRALSIARQFDSLTPEAKLEKILHLLTIIKEEQLNWHEDFNKKFSPLHDKVARKQRRKEFLLQDSLFQAKDKPLCEKWMQTLMQYVAPNGVSSFFLPPMARFFLSDNFLESILLKNVDFIMNLVHSREWKETVLYALLTSMFQDAFFSKQSSSPKKETLILPNSLLEKTKDIVSWVLHLASSADPALPFLPKEEVAQKVGDCAMNFAQSLFFEPFLLKLVQNLVSIKFPPGSLDSFVDTVTGDAKSIAFLIKKVVVLFVPQPQLELKPNIGSLIALGVKSAVIESSIKDKAEVLVYNEVPLKICQAVRLFVLSSFFDRVIYRAISI